MSNPAAPALLVAACFLLAPRAAAQPPVAMAGTWEVTVASTSHAPDGTAVKSKAKILLGIADVGADGLVLAPFATGDGLPVPPSSGLRLSRSFAASAEGAEIAGAVKVDAATGQGTSFAATGTVVSSGSIVLLRLKGKRVPGSTAPSTISIFAEDFEAGLGPYAETDVAGSPAATLWHAEGFCALGTAIPASLGAGAAAYNQGDLGIYNYNTSFVLNAGALQGPPVAVPAGAGSVRISFDLLRQTEPGTLLDQCFLDIRSEDDCSWVAILQLTDDSPCAGPARSVVLGPGDPTLDALIGKRFSHRFRFATGDGAGNDFLGWYVDNVQVEIVNP